MLEQIKQTFNDSIHTQITAADTLVNIIHTAGERLVQCLLNNGKVLTCGQSSSASDAQQFAAKMLNRLDTERPSLPAITLPIQPASITSIANYAQYNDLITRQLKALAEPKDLFFVISPSGTGKNILDAIEAAQSRQLSVIALTGQNGGEVADLLSPDNDLEIRVPADNLARIQETHRLIINCLCDIIDHSLFSTEATHA